LSSNLIKTNTCQTNVFIHSFFLLIFLFRSFNGTLSSSWSWVIPPSLLIPSFGGLFASSLVALALVRPSDWDPQSIVSFVNFVTKSYIKFYKQISLIKKIKWLKQKILGYKLYLYNIHTWIINYMLLSYVEFPIASIYILQKHIDKNKT